MAIQSFDVAFELPRLSLLATDLSSLQQSWCPGFRRGAVFVPTSQELRLGTAVWLHWQLPDGAAGELQARVIWVTPEEAAGEHPAGLGLQLSEGPEGMDLRQRIEAQLPACQPDDISGWWM